MKTIIKSIALCTSLLAVLSACSPDKKKETVKVQLTVNEQMQADELTDAGEQLVAPHTFHLADRAFALALEKNPNDKKAQFYRALLKRFMVLRGVATNIRPMIEKHGDVKLFERDLKKIPNSPVSNFLLVPENKVAKLMRTEEDIQNLLITYREAIQEFRDFISKNSDLKLDLKLNPVMFMSTIQENTDSNCKVVPGTSEEEGQIECDATESATMRVNIADLMVLKQMAAGEILYLSIYTSYNLNGAFEYGKAAEAAGTTLTKKQSMELAAAKIDLKLLKKQGLTAIRSLGADFGAAAKWAMKYQESICPKNQDGTPKKRKGYMFSDGLCIEDATLAERNLAILEQVLKGPIAVTMENGEEKVVRNINYLAPFNRPTADLRNWMPATWKDDGSEATSFKDKTFGGLFPDGDTDFLTKSNSN